MSDNIINHIFCDESRQSKDRFMVLGGIIIPSENIDTFNRTMEIYRKKYKMTSELKWSKVKRQKIIEYKGFIDYFFALINADKIHFKCVVIDNHMVDHKRYSNGNKEVGFYKFYYQLLFNCFGRQYYREGETKFIVHPDHRDSKYSLNELRDILNNGMAKKFGHDVRPFVSIEPKHSHDSEIVQINDIIIGAIGYQKNGYHLLSDSCKGKIELGNYILKSSGLTSLTENTPFKVSRFTIWNIKLSGK